MSHPSRPFGLHAGRTFTLTGSLAATLAGHTELIVPGQQPVCATGDIDLGDAVRLLRFYLDDEDYWLQVVMHAAETGDTILFGYHSVVPLHDDAYQQRLVGPGSKVGLPMYEHDGYLYSRQWGSGPGQAELIPFGEQVESPEARYRIQHLAMLYARDTGLPGRREFLLLSVEQDEHGARSLSTSLGVTLHPTDFYVT